MASRLNRRSFIRRSLAVSAGGAAAAQARASAQQSAESQLPAPRSQATLPAGKIADLEVSRLLLGGNLLTHFTHSRDLRYVYTLTAHYNTEAKIIETMALAEAHGINTLVIHTAPGVMKLLKKYRYQLGGKMQWIICPTAEVAPGMNAYSDQVRQIVDDGVDAVYLWGVRADALVAEGKVDLIREAVRIAKDQGVPSGVGAHDLRVVQACEQNKIDADFYIKTLHHHKYPSAPKPDELTHVHTEVPGYWCNNPQEVVEFMGSVAKPWLAFKVMAAGAIPPQDAFRFAFESGADHVLAGMFDFEIAEDVRIANDTLKGLQRSRPWRS